MNKIITIPSSYEEIIKTKDLVDGFIVGIKDMCVNANLVLDLEELKKILKEIKSKEVFVSLNKNMHNSDLNKVKDILLSLNKLGIIGVLYYDVSVLSIYNTLDLDYELVYSAEHLTTNYNTINYWNKMGAKYTYLSSDITMYEIKEILDNSKSKLLVNMFGYLPMFVSKRHIVKNYINNFKLDDSSKINYIEKENKVYPIIDNEIGTYVYSNNILNGLKESINLNIDYIVLNGFEVELNKLIEVINIFKSSNENNVEKNSLKLEEMFPNIDNGFLNKNTIYKVKKNEK